MRTRRPRPLSRVGFLPLVGLAGLVGCSVGPDYRAPEIRTPDAWHQDLVAGLREGKADLRTWWATFHDPVLDGLIARATEENLDLKTAASRVEQARALLGISRGQLLPTVDGVGQSTFYRQSERTVEGAPFGGEANQNHLLGLDASWEIDVFGGLRRGVEASSADLDASLETYRDFLVILYSEVAATYLELRALQARLAYARKNVVDQEESRKIVQARLDTGLGSGLDLAQAELNLTNTQALVPAIDQALRQTVHRLAVLLGEPPNALWDELAPPAEVVTPPASGPAAAAGEKPAPGEKPGPAGEPGAPASRWNPSAIIPGAPAEIAVGLPADLLRQRPDVRGAERALAAQTARIGVATADLYPRFFLNGTLSLEASRITDLFDASSSHAWGLGPSVRWNLFAGGRIRNAIRAQTAVAEQAMLQYEQSVLRALEEVENAMVAYVAEGERRDALVRSEAAARKTAELAMTLYRTGQATYLNVLDAQRSLTEQQDRLAESEGLVVQNLVKLYKALGGGWSPTDDVAPVEAAAAPAEAEGAASRG